MLQSIKLKARSLLVRIFTPIVHDIIKRQIIVWGDPARLKIAPTAQMVNTLFNTSSGVIEVGEYTFAGHNVLIITGTHHYEALLDERIRSIPRSGRDIIIGKGVWIGSNAVILGPSKIGDHAVIAASAVVPAGSQIPPGAVVAGIPARVIKFIPTMEGRSTALTEDI